VLLLMDEPFGSVDAQTREDLEDLVLRVRQERDITILLVTHDIDESVYVGDRVIVLTPGPGRVRAELTVNLPAPRDQITTKALPEFVRLRTDVSRLVRSRPEPTQPAAPATENQDHLSRTTPVPAPAPPRAIHHTDLVTYTIDITKSNHPEWTQLRKLKGSGAPRARKGVVLR
jgi:ABC-type proline/glycine betaine transport system ATPase subunit